MPLERLDDAEEHPRQGMPLPYVQHCYTYMKLFV